MSKIRLPSPALVVALVALAVALSGTAVAAGIVPLAKRALNADNAKHALVADTSKKLGPQATAALVGQAVEQAVPKAVEQATAQAGQAPGPASTAAGLITVKTAPWSLNPKQYVDFTVTCDAGQKAISGGWADPGNWATSYQTLPTADGSGWTTQIYVFSTAPGPQSGTVYAICLK